MKKSILTIALLAGVATSCTQGQKGDRHVVKQTYVHKYGVEVTPEDWQQRGQNGQVITKLDSGVVMTRNYIGGVLHGQALQTFPHSDQIATRESYVGGVLTTEIAYTLGGSPKCETQYDDDAKAVTCWFENGTPQSQEHFIGSRLDSAEYYDVDNKICARVIEGNGTRLIRDAYGTIVAHDTIDDGMLIERTTLHVNGAPKEILTYVNDVIEGSVKRFLPIGEPQSIEEWVNGKQHGITTIFQNGEKYAEVPYVLNVKEGVEKRFRDNGNLLVEEITWNNGQRHGPTYIHLDGSTRTEWFYKGANVSRALFDLNVKRQGR